MAKTLQAEGADTIGKVRGARLLATGRRHSRRRHRRHPRMFRRPGFRTRAQPTIGQGSVAHSTSASSLRCSRSCSPELLM